MFGDAKSLIQLDMSEYMEKFTVSRLVGSPPGYVGYEEGGQLTEAVRRRPYSVVLFDEIEKAHPDVWNMLLQIMEEGRLTDNVGRVVDFKNTIIIMTSNIGSHYILETAGGDWSKVEREATTALRGHFKPEFLNRVDDIIVFRPLGVDHISHIVDLQLDRFRKLLADRKMSLEVTPEAKKMLAEEGYYPAFGARPLKRVIQRLIQNPLAIMLLEGRFQDGDTIIVKPGEAGKLAFEKGDVPAAAAA